MKRAITLTLQALVTVALLWWIFRAPEKRALMAEALRSAELLWLLPALAAVGIAVVLQTQRWALLLRAQGISPNWERVLRITLIGNFFNLFLLGSTGGDIAKIFFMMQEAPQKKLSAFFSVIADRIVGILALVAISVAVILLRLELFWKNPTLTALLGALVIILGGSVGVVLTAWIIEQFRLSRFIPTWIPLHGKILEFAAVLSSYTRAWKALLAAFALSLPSHLLIFSAFYLVSRAFASGLSVADIFSVLPIVMVITALPISLSGLGVREELFQQTLGIMYGTAPAVAVLISMGGFLTFAFWGLLGGIVFIFYRSSDGSRASLREMQSEVEAVENQAESS